MYVKVPFIKERGFDVDNSLIIEGFYPDGDDYGYLWIRESELEPDWKEMTQLEWLAVFKGGVATVDKQKIKADGLDVATVTVEVHPDLTEVTFYHADTDEPIATVPVDPATHTATLQVTATTPGVIRIRAGEPTVTRLNEVVIQAQ